MRKNKSGKSFIQMTNNFVSKNVKESLNLNETIDVKQARMCEIPDKSKCPVEAYKIYMQKLPKDGENLFPKPLFKFTTNNFYSSKAVRGKDYLGNLMQKLSKSLSLSKCYTNHCIRSTVVSNLMDNGFDPSAISAVTGHKSFESLRKYASVKRKPEIESYSKTLSTAFHGNNCESSKMQKFDQPCSSKSIVDYPTNVSLNNLSEIKSLFGGSNNTININNINIYNHKQ